MLRKFAKRIGLNFKHTKSERVASQSYSNYQHKIKRMFEQAKSITKLNIKRQKPYDKS